MGFEKVEGEGELLDFLRKHLVLSDNSKEKPLDTAPILFSTSHAKVELGNRMLPSDLFALLSVHESLQICENSE